MDMNYREVIISKLELTFKRFLSNKCSSQAPTNPLRDIWHNNAVWKEFLLSVEGVIKSVLLISSSLLHIAAVNHAQRHSCGTVSCGTPTPETARMLKLSCRSSSHMCPLRSCYSTRVPEPTWRDSSHTQVSWNHQYAVVKETHGRVAKFTPWILHIDLKLIFGTAAEHSDLFLL